MPLYPPPAGTYSEQPPPVLRPATNRASTNVATAGRYRPRTYSHPPPTQPDPRLLGPAQTPYATPYPQQEIYTTAPPPLPMPQPAPIYPPPSQQYPQPIPGHGFSSSRHGSYAQPSRPSLLVDDHDPRHSSSTQRSHQSHDSRQSRHSKHSHDGRHSGDGKARRDHRVSIDDIDRRPTMGDSVIAFYKLVKSALGPRDK
ncbi:hypothetical protein Q7P36_004401 [Cladosporium allicinum]